MSTITLGVDLAKRVFSVCETDATGHGLRRQKFKRDAFVAWLGQQAAGTVVATKACSGAHHWARHCLALGLQPRVIAARHLTARGIACAVVAQSLTPRLLARAKI